MNIAVISGTAVKGITYHTKEMFLAHFGKDNTISEFYPDDMPEFCLGCKTCFLKGEAFCPHEKKTAPIWNALLNADLIVFAYPVYALRAPAAIKSLLDHLCAHWMVHRPDEKMFSKTVAIITNSIGSSNGAAQKDVKTSFSWMGTSRIYTCGARMMGDIVWDKLSLGHMQMLKKKMNRLYKKVMGLGPYKHMKPKESLQFFACKKLHRLTLKNEETPSLDNQHYLDRGWIKDPRR